MRSHKERGPSVEGLKRRGRNGRGLIDMSISPSEVPIRDGEQIDAHVEGLLKEIQKRGKPEFQRRKFRSKGMGIDSKS